MTFSLRTPLVLAGIGACLAVLLHGGPPAPAPDSPVTEQQPGPVATAVADSPATRSGTVRAWLTVPDTTLRAGGAVSGTFTVVNDSGRPLRLLGCGPVYRVLLVGGGHRPTPAWPLCAQEITLPTGESTIPVRVTATYDECSPTGGNAGPSCRPDGSLPLLPAGSYRAVVFGVSPDLPVPPPVSVTITR